MTRSLTQLSNQRCTTNGCQDAARSHRSELAMICVLLGLSAITGLLLQPLQAEDKKEPPVIKATVPLGIVDGMTVPLLIRGLKLGEVTELKFPDLKTAPVYQIKSKGAAPAVDKVAADKVGDTQLEVEITLPIDSPAGPTTLIVIGPNGQSEPRKLLILDSRKTVAEKEPNDGFSEAQEITLGQTITGVVSAKQNTDVYRFTGEKGQRVKIEVQAARYGSPLDPFITLHNSNGQLLAELDDGAKDADPVLGFTLPAAGQYFISILDAHDLSSPAHAYLLTVQGQ